MAWVAVAVLVVFGLVLWGARPARSVSVPVVSGRVVVRESLGRFGPDRG